MPRKLDMRRPRGEHRIHERGRLAYVNVWRSSWRGRHEWNDCTVVAVAVLLDCNYDEALELMEAYGRRTGRGVHPSVTRRVLLASGMDLIPLRGQVVDENGRDDKSHPWTDQLRGKTLVTVERELRQLNMGPCLIHCRRHVVAFNGEVICDSEAGTRRHALRVYQVVQRYDRIMGAPRRGVALPKGE